MKKLYLITILLLLMIQSAFSQIKEIKGDTTYWYNRNIEIQKTFGLKDFLKSFDEFNFRFRNQGQIIEISKNNTKFDGTITNYIYHTKKVNRSKTETLTNRIIIPPKQVEDIYNIVQQSKILDLPSDRNIENWKFGFDGITYTIEHSDAKNYWVKNYWTPTSQDSIPEAILVLELVEKLSDTLNLEETYVSFKNDLPKKGCYNSGGITNMCYVSNSLEVGYSGATKLPLGFYSSYSTTYMGKTKINGGAFLQYNFDNNGFHHLNFQIAKWNIFYNKPNFSDFVTYNYQNRILNISDTKEKFENHQMKYGLHLKKNISLGIGLDYIACEYDKIGGHLYAYKWFSKPNISTSVTTSIFHSQINYKAELFKSFNFNSKFLIRSISLGMAYEDFMKYKDLYFNVHLLF